MVQSDATDYDDVQEEPDNNRRTSRAGIGKIQRTKGYGGPACVFVKDTQSKNVRSKSCR